MIVRLAMRSLTTRPIRTAVLACGFGFGIGAMAALLGVGDVILEQAHSPALEGGGDLVIGGRYGTVESARFFMASVLGAPDLAPRATALSPTKKATLYLIAGPTATPVAVTGGIPSLEKAVGDPEVANAPEWVDAPADLAWSKPDAGEVLRSMDRFHPIPNTPEFSSSWAEWLYFNGRTSDGRVRFYLTFMVGPASPSHGRRVAGVRLQLDRDGQTTSYSAGADIDEAKVLGTAPDLEIGGNRVRLDGLRYRIDLALPGAAGTLVLDARPGQSLPPAMIRGARGWLTGYTAPVLSGKVGGTLTVGRDRIAFQDAPGYHDHNWGFWKGVRWQWGQVAHDDLRVRLSERAGGGDVGPFGLSHRLAADQAAQADPTGDAEGDRAIVAEAEANLDLQARTYDATRAASTASLFTHGARRSISTSLSRSSARFGRRCRWPPRRQARRSIFCSSAASIA